MKPCIHCASTVAPRVTETSEACLAYVPCDARRVMLLEPPLPPRPRCSFLYEDGQCIDREGHEPYDHVESKGHAHPIVVKLQASSTYGKLTRPIRRTSSMLPVLLVAALAFDTPSARAPRRPNLPPMLPPPRDPKPDEELPFDMLGGPAYPNPHGRRGKEPLPRAFYSSRPYLPGEAARKSDEAERGDERDIKAAEEKRARKAAHKR